MSTSDAPLLVAPTWLAAHLPDENVRVLDGSWHMPAEGRDPAAEFAATHIVGAAFFDIDGICEPDTGLPHTMPSAERFGRSVAALGVSNESHVVVYDTVGLFSAPRVWWMFRAFGHKRVSVLAGGLPAWIAEEHPIEARTSEIAPATFTAVLQPELLRSLDQIRTNVADGAAQVVDARSAGRFAGTDPEPRPGLASGHIPGSKNVPFPAVLAGDGSTLRGDADLRAIFAKAGVDPERPVITSCGSGITACTLALALASIGAEAVAVYDGSWTEWGGRTDTPIETGGS
jgi:thiosulfate/3-mercaptopyruvate sulfurtransferase